MIEGDVVCASFVDAWSALGFEPGAIARVFSDPDKVAQLEGAQTAEEVQAIVGQVSRPPARSRRSTSLSIEAYDLEGAPFRMDLEDFPARVVQHDGPFPHAQPRERP